MPAISKVVSFLSLMFFVFFVVGCAPSNPPGDPTAIPADTIVVQVVGTPALFEKKGAVFVLDGLAACSPLFQGNIYCPKGKTGLMIRGSQFVEVNSHIYIAGELIGRIIAFPPGYGTEVRSPMPFTLELAEGVKPFEPPAH